MSVLTTQEERIDSLELLRKEASIIISVIDRLIEQRKVLSDRVQNGISMVCTQ